MVPRRWSPLFCLPRAKLTSSGLLELEGTDGEVEVLTRSEVGLRIYSPIPIAEEFEGEDTGNPTKVVQEYVDRDVGLICIVTTHRLVFIENSLTSGTKVQEPTIASYIHLSTVSCVSAKGIGFMASPKLQMSTYKYGDVIISFDSSSRDRDEMLSSLSRCLGRKAWEASSRQLQKQLSLRDAGSRKVGVDAIMSKNKERHDEAKRISEVAFSKDVEGLMSEARDLVQVINKYVATLDKKKKADSKQGDNSDQAVDDEEETLSALLSNMGMMSAITKQSAGSLYHQQIARQLSDFLRHSKVAMREGGIATLTDVYCLFNRARGANLISPDDMMVAATLLKDLRLGFAKREFPSGVVVLQSHDYDDDVMSKKLQVMADAQGNGVTSLFVSSQFKTNTVLATEQLQTAEKLGYLCRDATVEGIRFFSNKFVNW